jgi:hypothetical protein
MTSIDILHSIQRSIGQHFEPQNIHPAFSTLFLSCNMLINFIHIHYDFSFYFYQVVNSWTNGAIPADFRAAIPFQSFLERF